MALFFYFCHNVEESSRDEGARAATIDLDGRISQAGSTAALFCATERYFAIHVPSDLHPPLNAAIS